MKHCSYCGRENQDEAVRCYECGTEFKRPIEPAPPEPKRSQYDFPPLSPADRQKALVTLVKCATLLAADAVATTLRVAGIEAFIPDEGLILSYGLTTTFGYVRVQVSLNDYDEAKDLLSATFP